ncbi:MAG: exosortase system-associated protein, TIGR04073 family [Verrucomicrobiota bacterium JB023]|nr:exosortase system-associated protein, TIGR04073 family [Verrucomicrobiota bacterium JB023]
MKKLILAATLLGLVGTVHGDIQAPPGAEYTSSRKLGRAISNILYGVMEIPEQLGRKNDSLGRKAGWSYGLVNGTQKAFKRMGYGFYELFTFHCPTYKGTFKPPYSKCGADWRVEMNPSDGLSEFPPELGFESYFSHTRTQTW